MVIKTLNEISLGCTVLASLKMPASLTGLVFIKSGIVLIDQQNAKF